jgi:ankyrin repeat protein
MPHQNSPVDQGELPNEGPLSQPRRTSLSLAAEKGVESQVRLLLADGADATLKDMDGRTPLSYAASHGHAPIVELLLSQEGVEPDSRDKHGKSPLSWAAQCGHENIVKILLANDKVDPHWHNEFGVGPLVFSVGGGNESIVKLLLTKGVDPGRQLGALLIMAEENGHLGIFEALKKSVVPTVRFCSPSVDYYR